MFEWFEIIKYVFPMLIMGLIFYFLVEKFFSEQHERAKLKLQLKNHETFLPQKYAAYERMALFLERIRPTNLVRRVGLKDNADLYEFALVNAIQEEFDHNASQQIYVEPETWKVIFSAKNAMQNYIKQARENLTDKNDASAFQQALIQKSVDGNIPINGALLKLQSDIQG